MELSIDFHDLSSWLTFFDNHGYTIVNQLDDAVVQKVLRNGFVEPLTDTVVPVGSIENIDSWREGFTFRGVPSRQRAVMKECEEVIRTGNIFSPRIYAPEALSPFALRLRGLFPRFLGTEFLPDEERRQWIYPIPFGDLGSLDLPSDTFDIACVNEVLEHVPCADLALSELARILRPGGSLIGTVSLRYRDGHSIRRAKMNEDRPVHLMEPEYRGGPADQAGTLVFEEFGWDLLARARSAGFRRAAMRYSVSTKHCIADRDAGGIFVLRCEK